MDEFDEVSVWDVARERGRVKNKGEKFHDFLVLVFLFLVSLSGCLLFWLFWLAHSVTGRWLM